MLKEKAVNQLRHIFTKAFCRKLSHNIRFAKRQQIKKAIVIQKHVRLFLARLHQEKQEMVRKRMRASELVSRHLRGYWHRRMINWLRSQIRACLVIQTHWRMFKGIIPNPLIL